MDPLEQLADVVQGFGVTTLGDGLLVAVAVRTVVEGEDLAVFADADGFVVRTVLDAADRGGANDLGDHIAVGVVDEIFEVARVIFSGDTGGIVQFGLVAVLITVRIAAADRGAVADNLVGYQYGVEGVDAFVGVGVARQYAVVCITPDTGDGMQARPELYSCIDRCMVGLPQVWFEEV